MQGPSEWEDCKGLTLHEANPAEAIHLSCLTQKVFQFFSSLTFQQYLLASLITVEYFFLFNTLSYFWASETFYSPGFPSLSILLIYFLCRLLLLYLHIYIWVFGEHFYVLSPYWIISVLWVASITCRFLTPTSAYLSFIRLPSLCNCV